MTGASAPRRIAVFVRSALTGASNVNIGDTPDVSRNTPRLLWGFAPLWLLLRTRFGDVISLAHGRYRMAERTHVTQNFIDARIGEALSRNGLAQNHVIRQLLDSEAEVFGLREPGVRCSEKSLDDRIAELRDDPRFANSFPRPLPKISKQDLPSLRSEFQRIADGSVRVE
jgi:hypothetical protein